MTTVQSLKKQLRLENKRQRLYTRLAFKAGSAAASIEQKIFNETVIKKYGREFRYRGLTYAIIGQNRVKTVKQPVFGRWFSKSAWHLLDFLKGKSSSPFTYIPTEKALRSKIKKGEAWKKALHEVRKKKVAGKTAMAVNKESRR